MRIINRKLTIDSNDAGCIAKCMGFIDAGLADAGVVKKLAVKAQLSAEEMLATLLEHADAGAAVRIQIRKMLGDTAIYISARGQEFDLEGAVPEFSGSVSDGLEDEETQAAIRSIILKAQGENIKLSHRDGVNKARILTGQSGSSALQYTVIAIILGLLVGLLFKTAALESVSSAVCGYVLRPFQTMFMNALKVVIAPVVFFSIVSCVSQFQNLSELGRIGARIIGMFLLASAIAAALGIGVSALLSPGEFGAALGGDIDVQSFSVDTDVDTSLLSMIINIVPSNFVRPFLESDTLQLIFLAILCGVAVGMIGEYTSVLKEFFDACNSLFLMITSIIAKLIPAAVFCSIVLMLVDMGGNSFVAVMGMVGTILVGLFLMMIAYGILVLVLGKLNPLVFYRKIREGMLTSFTLSSSSAAMPTNLRMCSEKLGISNKVCNFSIPLGATINMDGLCLTLIVIGLFLAKMYGVTVTGSMMLSLALTAFLLSVGCPGVAGAGLICVGLILVKLGVPVEAIGFVIAIFAPLDMFICMCNITGHISDSAITASKEGLIDKEVFYDGKY
ncbi:MAG: dicarboxylate/amino acid:cation symporter [Firmicutes bacterium]|nr:dicarboxylate/amino acid:cation symporter [Bacillota bacterium]